MPVEQEQLQQYFTVIQGGLQYPASSAEQLVADNGNPLFNVVNETTYAWNGLVAEAQAIVTVGAAAVATGMGLLTAPVSAPVVAIGLALGLTSGYLLYDLEPEFFDEIAEELMEAGQTIGGKVIQFVDDTGLTGYTQETIEIIKNALLAKGAFETTTEVDADDAIDDMTQNLNMQEWMRTYQPKFSIGGFSYYTNNNEILNEVSVTPADSYVYTVYWGSASASVFACHPTTVPSLSQKSTIVASGRSWTTNLNYNGRMTAFGGQTFPLQAGTNGAIPNNVPYANRVADDNPNSLPYGQAIAYMLLFGRIITQGNVQDGATIPTGDPISTTYPNWDPWTVPQEIPDLTIFPVSEPVPDGEQDPAQTGENEEEEQIQSIWDKIFIPDPPDPDPIPPEPPVPDPDPQPDDPDPIPDPDPVPPEPDPPDPNPPIPPSPVPIIPVLPEIVSSNAMFTVYRPSISQLNSFGGWLWSSSIVDQLLRMWSDPLNGIIAFHKVYASPTVGAASNIIVGYLDSGVAAPIVTSQFTTTDCGSINIAEKMHNATDYSPYTSLHLYLPFIGFVELDVNEFMSGTIAVKYHVDVYTGTCLAEVTCTRNPDMPNETIIYTFSGNASQQLPLTSSNFAGAISALVGAVGGALSIPSGGAVTGFKEIGHSLTHEMIHIGHSGSLSANAGIMAARTPFIILSRRNGYDANAYNELYGYPANKTVYLSNCNGYTKVKAGFLRSKATENEKSEIMALLKKGVIL